MCQYRPLYSQAVGDGVEHSSLIVFPYIIINQQLGISKQEIWMNGKVLVLGLFRIAKTEFAKQ